MVDIDPQGSIAPSKGLINSHGTEWGHWMARGSINNFCGLLEQWSLQFKIIINRARNGNGVFQQIMKLKMMCCTDRYGLCYAYIYSSKHVRNLVGDTRDMSPHFSRRGGHNMHCPPTFFSLGCVFRGDSKIKMFVMFCVKSYSC